MGEGSALGAILPVTSSGLFIAQLLWSFDIKAGDADDMGKPVSIDPLAYTDGLVMRALPLQGIL